MKLTKGDNSVKTESYVMLRFFCYARRLIMPYICTRLHEDISFGFKVKEHTQHHYIK